MRIVITILLAVSLISCGNQKEDAVAVTSTFDTVAITETLTDSVTVVDSVYINSGMGDSQLYYIVSADEGTDYINLKATALKVSEKLKVGFDSLERGYDPKKQRVVLPCNHPDEIYACDYLLRRHGDDFVSIEMRNAYPDTFLKDDGNTFFYSDTTKMYICAAICVEKRQADSLVTILKKQFPHAKVIENEIYMGCMH